MNKAINFLEKNESATPSKWEEEARFRQENKVWLTWSRKISLSLIEYMEENQLSRADLAKKLDVTPQYISKLLSGSTNLSLKSIAELKEKLEVPYLSHLFA